MVARLSDELMALERRLSQQARQVSVLEEFGLTYEDYLFLERDLSALFRHSPSRAITLLGRHGRYSTAAFLALVGVYKYAQDDGSAKYWPHVADALGVRSVPQGDLGEVVEQVVRLGGMAAFPKAEGGRRFVDLILLHGGIPNGCLADYFDRVLRHAHPASSGRDVIGAALEPSQERYLLKPVARYLRYGGDVAADFVERTLDLTAHGHRLREAQDPCVDVLRAVASEVGLPVRVVKAYREWLAADPERGDGSRTRKHGRQWRSPTLRFDPRHLVPVIDLPAQELSGSEMGGRWTVWAGADASTVEVAVWRRAGVWRTDPHVHALASPQTHYDVGWLSLEGERRWALPGLTLRWPLLAFNGRDGQHVDVADGLPRDDLWILRPETHDLTCEGALLAEAEVPLSGPWKGYVVERWNLRSCPPGSAPRVGDVDLWLRTEGDVRPHLAEQPVPGVSVDDVAVFTSWPSMVIPRARPDEEVGRWSLRWATPEEEGEVALVEFAADVGGGWEVDLEAAGLPPYVPIALRLRGPLGRSARLNVAVWEGLDVEGAGRLVLPADGDPATAEISVGLPEGLGLLSVEGETYERGGRRARVEVHPHVDRVGLRVSAAGSVHTIVVAVPRLRSHAFDAAVAGPSTALATASPLHIQGDWLDQAAIPRVAFVTSPADASVDAVEVDFGAGDVVPCPRAGGRADVFDLSELAQAAAVRRRARARLWAYVGRSRVPVGEWHARLGLQGLRAVAQEDAAGVTVRAHWAAGHLVEGVQARLWSVWSPWDAPLQADVEPDGPSACAARFGHVQPGRYLVELAVEDPWSPAAPRRPPADAPGVAPLDVGSVRDRHERLAAGSGVRADVTRYLAASGDAVGRASAWRRACGEATSEDVGVLLSVAGVEAGDDVWERLARAQRDRLFDFLEPVAERDRPAVVAALATEDAHTLAAYAVVLGYLDSPPEDWGGHWEPLAACGAGPRALADPYRLARLCGRLGLTPPPCGPERPDGDAPPEELQLADWVAARGDFGERPNDAFASSPLWQIQAIRSALGLVPGGALSPSAQQVGYAEWLMSRAERPQPSDVLARDAADLKRDLRALLDLDPDGLAPVVRCALAREHPLASGGQAPAWLNGPFAVGAVAVLLRAQALHASARVALEGHRNWIRASALRALRAAPDLFAHDLSWVHLGLVHACTTAE